MPRLTTKQNHLPASLTPVMTTYSQIKKCSRLTNPLGARTPRLLTKWQGQWTHKKCSCWKLESPQGPTHILEEMPPCECIHPTTRVKVKNPMMLGMSLEDLSPLLPYGWNWQVGTFKEMDDACKTTLTMSGITHNATVHWTDWAEQTSLLNLLFRNTLLSKLQ